MYPTGTATLGITASDSEIKIIDPLLTLIDNLLKFSGSSPVINSGLNTESFMTEDMDGQLRDDAPDVGVDEYSTQAPNLRPLTPADVGVNAF